MTASDSRDPQQTDRESMSRTSPNGPNSGARESSGQGSGAPGTGGPGSEDALLLPDEPAPLAAENLSGRSSLVLVCEHGGRRFPKRLDSLGLHGADREKHFVWDIGALEVARALSRALDAPLLHQHYSRLVCDCNRRPDVPSYIPSDGEGIPVPGNRALTLDEHRRRTEIIWRPFHDGIAALLDRRTAAGRNSILVSIHSFTPVFFGVPRPWRVGVLLDRDPKLSPALLEVLRTRFGDRAGRNEPYPMDRDSDYTIPVHGEDRGLPCAEIEIRNDLIRSGEGVSDWAAILAGAIRDACAKSDLTLDSGN